MHSGEIKMIQLILLRLDFNLLFPGHIMSVIPDLFSQWVANLYLHFAGTWAVILCDFLNCELFTRISLTEEINIHFSEADFLRKI